MGPKSAQGPKSVDIRRNRDWRLYNAIEKGRGERVSVAYKGGEK